MSAGLPHADVVVQRRILTVLAAGQILAGVGTGAAVSLGALLAAAVSGSDALSGLATTLTTLGAAACALPLATLAGRSGRRRALALGAGIAALGGVVVIVAAALGSFAVLLAGFALLGAGNAVRLQSRFAAVDLAAPTRRGRDLSLVVWSTTVGIVVGPNLVVPGEALGRVIGLPPLTGAFALTVACQLLAAALYVVALRPDPLLAAQEHEARSTRSPSPSAPRRRWTGFAVLGRNPRAAVAVIVLALSQGVMVGIMAMTPVHMKGFGATIGIVGLTISIHTAGMFAVSPLFGWLSDRLGRATVVLGGQAMLAASLLVNVLGQGSEGAVIVALALLGLGWSASTVAGSALLADSLTVAERPSVQGLSDTLMNLSGAAGSAVAGLLFAVLGYGVLNAVTLIVIVVVVVAVVGTVARSRRAVGDDARR